MGSLVVYITSYRSLGPLDGVCSVNQDQGGEKLPGVLELELFRRHQVLPPGYAERIFDPDLRVHGVERRSQKE
jgi:hypothetical protein